MRFRGFLHRRRIQEKQEGPSGRAKVAERPDETRSRATRQGGMGRDRMGCRSSAIPNSMALVI